MPSIMNILFSTVNERILNPKIGSIRLPGLSSIVVPLPPSEKPTPGSNRNLISFTQSNVGHHGSLTTVAPFVWQLFRESNDRKCHPPCHPSF